MSLLPSFEPAVAEGSDAGPARIAVVGDVILGNLVNTVVAREGPEAPLGGLDILREADLAIANLESVATEAGDRPAKPGLAPHYFRSRPETLGVLTAAGIDAVSTANNHAGDMGRAAILEQGALLDEIGVAHVGAGPTAMEACAPVYLDAGGGIVVALFGADATEPGFAADEATPGTCHVALGDADAWDARFADSIAASRRHAHAVLFAVHWGDDWVTEPSEAQRTVGRRLVDLGVDVVVGAHAHVLQGVERHGSGLILHGTAHALTSFEQPTDSAVFTIDVTEQGVTDLVIHPIVVEADGVGARPVDGAEATRILDLLRQRSGALGTELDDAGLSLEPAATGGPVEPPASLVTPEDGLRVPEAADEPPPGCVVDEVPADARIEPIRLGPLRLVGMEVIRERYVLPELVDLDLYWELAEPTDEPLTIVPHGSRDGADLSLWLSEHEPCDWGWPTSRWETGTVYRDQATLRPPPEALSVLGAARVASGVGGEIEVSVGVAADGVELARTRTLASVGIGAPGFVLPLVALVALVAIVLLGVAVVRRRRRAG